jgi:uncharacterized protein Usg
MAIREAINRTRIGEGGPITAPVSHWHGGEGGQAMNDQDLVCQLTGWRQTTAEILYRMPDHPGLVQTFLWQDLDRWHDDPRLTFPRLRQFCDWWNANLDGPIVQVRVGAALVVTAGELRHVDAELRLH